MRASVHILFVALSLSYVLAAFPQTIPLQGTVVIQNSEYETGHKIYVRDASIRAPFAKAVTSDKDGQFSLLFIGVENGSPVRLAVSKPGLEVVNTRELEQVIIGRVPNLPVVMADAQKLADAQMEFYQIATETIARDFERRMAALRDEKVALADRLAAAGESGDTLGSLSDAMIALTDQRGAALDRARDLAREFALVDLDDASALYRTAYEHFRRGEIDSTLQLLNAQRLDADYASALDQKARGREVVTAANRSIRQLHQCLSLKEDVLNAAVRYRECVPVLDEMARIEGEQPDVFGDRERCGTLLERATMLLYAGDLNAAMQAGQEARAVAERTLGPQDLLRAQAYLYLGILHGSLGAYDSASTWMDRALRIREEQLGPDDLLVGEALREIGQNQLQEGNFEVALSTFKRARAIFERTVPANDVRHAFLFSSFGMLYSALGDPQNALAAYDTSLKILTAAYGPNHPQLTTCYSNMAVALNELGRHEEALRYGEGALELDQRFLGADHPDVASDYNNLSAIYLLLNDVPHALECMQKVLAIQLMTLSPDHPDLVLTYNNLAGIIRRTKDYQAALVEVNKGIDLADRVLDPGHPWRLALDINKGSILDRLGDHRGALLVMQHGLLIAERREGTDRTGLATLHVGMGHIEEKQDHLDDALAHYRTAYATRSELLGPEHQLTFLALHDIGRCQWRRGQLDSAWTILEQTSRTNPQGMSHWYLYKVAMDQGRKDVALDHLITSIRLREEDGYDQPSDREESRQALKDLAAALGRPDVLQEFHLE